VTTTTTDNANVRATGLTASDWAPGDCSQQHPTRRTSERPVASLAVASQSVSQLGRLGT